MSRLPTDLEIRGASADELRVMLDWAAEEGWNPGLEDAGPFLAADPDGFLLATVAGEPVASVSAVRYGDGFGFVGFYICRPNWRGRGIGYRIWQVGLERLGDRIIGLDGVIAQQPKYRASGFTYVHGNKRFAGPVLTPPPADPRVCAVAEAVIPRLLAYDRPYFPADRSRFLASWLTAAPTRSALALMDGDKVMGYGVIRDCRSGSKIGPLLAETEADAELLFLALAGLRPGRRIILDTPLPNPAAVAIAHRHGLSPIFETARMYRGGLPHMPLDRIFGIATFELG